MPLLTASFGPFTKGILDTGNPSVDLTGALRVLREGVFAGAMRLRARPGDELAMTLYDDAGTPAVVTNVIAIQAFADGALAVGYSSVTHKCYLYKLTAALDGWYNAAGALQSNLLARPQGVLWSTMTTVPDVVIAEGLGVAYIAHTAPADALTLDWATRTYDNATRVIADLSVDLDGSGAKPVYFATVASFQQHLWGAGFGTGAAAATGYRPELARYSQPNFGTLQAADSITVGDRVRSERERIVGFGVAEDALYIGAPFMLSRVTGFGRNSWYRKPLDRSHGFVGPKCMVADGATLYYWSSRGPMRVRGDGAPEPLWDGVAGLVERVVNPQTIVAARDEARDLVTFTVDIGTGVRTWCGYDTRRELWIGPDCDWGLAIRCGGEVDPTIRSTATPPGSTYPQGNPSAPSTTSIGSTSATANWTNGDATASTIVYLQRVSLADLGAITTVPPGTSSYTFTGLDRDVEYQWAVEHTKGGQQSARLGPDVDTDFTTSSATLNPPTGLTLFANFRGLRASWTNSGESGVETSVELSGPSDLAPDETTYSQVLVVASGVSSCLIPIATDGTYWVRVQHITAAGDASIYLGPSSVYAIESK
jgi:hypothetical protein